MSFHPNDTRFLVGVLESAREQPNRMPYELSAIDNLVEHLNDNLGADEGTCAFCGQEVE